VQAATLLTVNEQDMSRDTLVRLSVPDAASRLGVTQSAIRKRVQRGQIPYDKDERGYTYVYLSHDASRDSDNTDSHVTADDVTGQADSESRDTGHVEDLRDRILSLEKQVSFLQDELRARREEMGRKDSVIMSLTQRIPELEAPSEPSESPLSAQETQGNRPIPQDEERPSWWRRFFGV
jgi:beta-lactamase class A